MDVHSIFETDSDLQQWSEDIILDCYNGQSVAANSIILGISTGSPALREMLSIAVSSSEAKLPMYGDRMEQWKLALRFLYPLERRTAVTWVSKQLQSHISCWSDVARLIAIKSTRL